MAPPKPVFVGVKRIVPMFFPMFPMNVPMFFPLNKKQCKTFELLFFPGTWLAWGRHGSHGAAASQALDECRPELRPFGAWCVGVFILRSDQRSAFFDMFN